MAIQAGVGISTEINPILAAKEAVRMASLHMHAERADLAFAFSSADLSYPSLLKTLSASLEHVPIIGSSGAAIISNQGIARHGVAVMLVSLPKNVSFSTAEVKDIKTRTPLVAGKELARELLKDFKDMRVLSTTFSDGMIEEGSSLIYGMQEIFGRSFPMVGASASCEMRSMKTFLYFNQEVLTDSAIGILWGGRLNFGLGIKHGWKPLGKPHSVTKSYGNVVYEIDNEPAANIYEEYLGRKLSDLRQETRLVSVLYPIGIHLAGEEEYLLRNILSIGTDGSLRLQGNVNQGNSIRLMIGTKESALAATEQAGLQAKGTLPNTEVDFALIFDSFSRYILLKRDAAKELEIIKETLGKDTPIIGLYTFGEQAPLRSISYQGQTYFHNQTITILTVGGQ